MLALITANSCQACRFFSPTFRLPHSYGSFKLCSDHFLWDSEALRDIIPPLQQLRLTVVGTACPSYLRLGKLYYNRLWRQVLVCTDTVACSVLLWPLQQGLTERGCSLPICWMNKTAACVSLPLRGFTVASEKLGSPLSPEKAMKRSLNMKSFKCGKHLLWTQEAEKRRLWVQGQPGLHREFQDTRATEQRDPVSKSKTEKTTCCGMALLKAICVLSQKKSLYLRSDGFQDRTGEMAQWPGHVLLLQKTHIWFPAQNPAAPAPGRSKVSGLWEQLYSCARTYTHRHNMYTHIHKYILSK